MYKPGKPILICLLAVLVTGIFTACEKAPVSQGPVPAGSQTTSVRPDESVPASSMPDPSSAISSIVSSLQEDSSTPDLPGGALPAGELASLEKQAAILTDHLITASLDSTSLSGQPVGSHSEISGFLLTLARYMDRPTHPYYDFVIRTPEYLYLFPKENVEQIAWELFGMENWEWNQDGYFDNISIRYNDDEERYESGLEFGVGGYYSAENYHVESAADSESITVYFDFTDYSGFEDEPGWGEHGEYSITFAIMEEGGQHFLRYTGIKPLE